MNPQINVDALWMRCYGYQGRKTQKKRDKRESHLRHGGTRNANYIEEKPTWNFQKSTRPKRRAETIRKDDIRDGGISFDVHVYVYVYLSFSF